MRPLAAFSLSVCLIAQTPAPYRITAEDRGQIVLRAGELERRLTALRGRDEALVADVEVYLKAAQWILRFEEEFYTQTYLANTLAVIDRGLERARELATGQPSWPARTGRVIRAYRSRVDGSVQPYAVHVPESYDAARPMRLDVVLHGRGATLNEVSFIASHEGAKPPGRATPHLQLHVFGRTNNAYRWAGETDVFEALESVRSRYNVDPDRIVLRGFSMGGAGAWHIGLHHPDKWAAVEAGAGFTETKRYAKLGDIPEWQQGPLRIYDAVDYAPNAWNVPMVGYGGEDDPQLQASVNIRERLVAEGLKDVRALFLVGPKTEHRWHPDSQAESDRFLDAAAVKGRAARERIRFVTYTTRYNRSFGISVEGLERHYQRAEVDAARQDGRLLVRTRNITHLRLPPGDAVLDGQPVKIPSLGWASKADGKWHAKTGVGRRKENGLQGPIDDAFMDSFLCVRPASKTPPALERFAREWAKWMRGDVRIKEDGAVTKEDMEKHHLVLFGTPEDNRLIRRVAPHLPVVWGKEVRLGVNSTARGFPGTHTLVMIYPNPLNPKKYVVLNTGHTFGEADFRGTNALLYPRLGDWAVLNARGEVASAGLFAEDWRLPAVAGLH